MEENNQKRSKGLMIAFIAVAFIAILQLGVLGFMFKDNIIEFMSTIKTEKVEILIYPLESMQVNLAGNDNYLRTTVELEYTNPDKTPIVETYATQIRATILNTLRSKTIKNIETVEQTKQLAKEIVNAINDILGEEIMTNAYFVEFVYQ